MEERNYNQVLSDLKNKIGLNDRVYLDIFAIYSLFLIYFYFNWHGSGPYVAYETIWKVVDPYIQFMNEGLTIDLLRNGWGISGKQFFLFPLLYLLGTSPQVLMIIQVTGFAIIGPLVYFILTVKFDRYTAYGVAIIFITFRTFQKWRTSDMYLFFLLIFGFLLLYIMWRNSQNHLLVVPMAFLTGFSSYILTISIYPMIALIISTLIFEHQKIREIPSKIILVSLIVFTVGLTPILAYSYSIGFYNLSTEITVEQHPGVIESFEQRASHLNKITSPTFFIYKGDLQYRTHIYSILIGAGILVSILRKKNIIYLFSLGIVFLLSTFTPDPGLAVHQAMVVYPFILIMIAQGFQKLNQSYDMRFLAIILGLIVLTLSAGDMTENDIHPGSVSLEEFEEFKDHETSRLIITNHRHFYSIISHDQDTESLILTNASWNFRYQVSREDSIDLEDLKEIRHKSQNYTFIFYNETNCKPLSYGAERCGYETDFLIKHLDINEEDYEKFSRKEVMSKDLPEKSIRSYKIFTQN